MAANDIALSVVLSLILCVQVWGAWDTLVREFRIYRQWLTGHRATDADPELGIREAQGKTRPLRGRAHAALPSRVDV